MADLEIASGDVADLARGAAFLGTGGGGDPYIGRLMLEQALADGGSLRILDVDDIPDDALVIPTALMGAPTVLVEKLPGGDEVIASLRKLEAHLGERAYATMPIEAGGINSTTPLVVGARLGLPVVDGDGMGRAFPELQMETFAVYGVSGTPMVVTNEYGDSAIIEAHSNWMAEWIARGITIRMGGTAYIAVYPMRGRDVKRTAIRQTLTLALRIGRCLGRSREAHREPFSALIEELAETHYGFGKVIFHGKVADLERRTTQGFARGRAILHGIEHDRGKLELVFQNEYLIARTDDRLLAIVPDLICVLDSETAEPITTEMLRYGTARKGDGRERAPDHANTGSARDFRSERVRLGRALSADRDAACIGRIQAVAVATRVHLQLKAEVRRSTTCPKSFASRDLARPMS